MLAAIRTNWMRSSLPIMSKDKNKNDDERRDWMLCGVNVFIAHFNFVQFSPIVRLGGVRTYACFFALSSPSLYQFVFIFAFLWRTAIQFIHMLQLHDKIIFNKNRAMTFAEMKFQEITAKNEKGKKANKHVARITN